MRKNGYLGVIAAILLVLSAGASAQPYPNKGVRIVIAFPSGGSIDTLGRILAQKLSQVPGVGLVGIGGEQHPAVRIQFNPGVTPHQFTSEADILAAAKAGQITLINTGEVYRDSVVGGSSHA